MKYQAYSEYKDSGVEWIGAIPKLWVSTRLKFESEINMGQSPNSEDCNQDGYGLPFLQGNAEFGFRHPLPKKYGKYVVWPENIKFTINKKGSKISKESLITSSIIGKYFQLTANKTNYIISELGWIEKGIKGWTITKQGEKQGGLQSEDFRSGIPYVEWPESILRNKSLNETIDHLKGNFKAPEKQKKTKEDFREKFEAKHRATDGHFVRSRAEMLIDNWLYMAEIVHAYERKLPIEEDVYSDFYIPTGKVYIEFWGLENDPKYRARKEKKIEIYKKYGFNLIELQDKEVQNLDDFLPRLLLKFGVQAY